MFVPLHGKSDYSLGYGTAAVDELVAAAAALGYRALALTDLENLYGQVRFHRQCRHHGIRPLTGIELRPGFAGRQFGNRTSRLVLLAADATGYRSLCRIVSRRYGVAATSAEGAPDNDLLPLTTSCSEGLFALSDDPDVLARLLAAGGFPRQRLGLLLVRPEAPAADAVRQAAARRLGVPVVADLDALFLQPADYRLHLLQRAIRQRRTLGEVTAGDDIWIRERWLRAPAAAAALFADLPQAVAATTAIAEACRFDLAAGSAPFVRPADPPDAAEKLQQLGNEALKSRSSWSAAQAHRLEEELATFARLGFSGWLLTVAEIFAHCRREGIPATVRGSAVGSLVLHLLGGSTVDPLAHGLLFERFLHPGKSTWPDVDIDLPWQSRDAVIDWVYDHFGRERVTMAAAHHTFQQRAALREGLKAWGVRPALIDRLSRALPPADLPVEEIDFLGLAAAADVGEPLTELAEAATGLGDILPLCQRLIGKPRHIAAHPGGIVVMEPPLDDLLPLERAPKGVVVTQFDGAALERLGVAKIDLLGNRCLSELEETFALAGRPPPLRLDEIPAGDMPTLALIDRADTLGCFQLESPAMRSLLTRLPIRRQSDVVAALALIRPGAAAGEAKAAFVRRARGVEPVVIPFPQLADRLAETYGLLLYEEDIMLLLSRTGGLSLAETDELRAAIVASGGETAPLVELEAGFLRRAAGQGIAAGGARRAWAAATRFAAYSFNKAHAASYGRLAYLSAYTKAHHPVEFACALLNHHQGLYPLRTLAAEFVRTGIDLRGPHVNFSGMPSGLEAESAGDPAAVRVGLDKIRGLSRRGAEALLQERVARGPFASLRELLERVRLTRREIAALVLAGAGDGLPPLAAADYPFPHEAVLDWLRQGGEPADLDRLPIPRPATESARTRLYQNLVRARNELRYVQMHLTAHPLALLRPEAQRYACLPLIEAVAAPAGTKVRLAVIVAALRRVPTGQGPMQFLTIEDETGLLEAAVLPPAYKRLGERIATPGPFLVEGRLRRQQGAVHLDVSDITPFHERDRPYGLKV